MSVRQPLTDMVTRLHLWGTWEPHQASDELGVTYYRHCLMCGLEWDDVYSQLRRNMGHEQDFVWNDIREERERQDKKWGADRCLNPDTWVRVILEELGEVAKEIDDTEPINTNRLYAELIQVAASSVAWAERLVGHDTCHGPNLCRQATCMCDCHD